MRNKFIIKSNINNYYRKFTINNESNYIIHFRTISKSIFKQRLINKSIYGIELYKY